MKHFVLTALALLSGTLPSMAGNLSFGELDEYHIAALSVIIIIGLPFFIIIMLLYFSYKNKQAKYKLASETLAAGKDIPENLFKNTPQKENIDVLQKGIKNIFLGILIICIGMGQVVIAYVTRPNRTDSDSQSHSDIEKQ